MPNTALQELFQVNTRKNTTEKEFTQDYIPIKDVDEGVIITDRGTYVKIVEITPTNFLLKADAEKELTIRDFASWLRIAPKEFQLKIVSETPGTNEIIDQIGAKLRLEENANCRALTRDYMSLVGQIGKQSAVQRHFYIIFKYEEPQELFQKRERQDIIRELQRTEETIDQNLSRIGNHVIKTKNPNNDTAKFLYKFYNKRSMQEETLNDRIKRIAKDMAIVNDVNSISSLPTQIDIKDIVAPRTIDTMNPEYLIVDGVYKTFLCLDGNSLPTEVFAGWVSQFIGFGDGIDVDVYVKKEDPVDFMGKVNQKLKFSRIKLNSRSDTQADYDQIVDNISACQYFKDHIRAGGEEPFTISIIITINAYTTRNLWTKKQLIENSLKMVGIKTLPIRNIQEDVWLCTAPYMMMDQKLYKGLHRNTTTTGVACTYPFTAFELTDKSGIMLGINPTNQSLCMLDLFDTTKYRNANMTIFGATGSGKSYFLQLLALRQRCMGIETFIISPDKQDEFQRSCNAVGGTFVDISAASNDCINLMEIIPMTSPANEYLNGESYKEGSWLLEKVQDIKTFVSLLVNDLTQNESAIIERVAMKVYEEFGIEKDNKTIYKDPDNQKGGLKEMPIIEDLYNKLREEDELRPDIANILSKFVTGSVRSFNGKTNVELDNKYIVFGFENLAGTDMLAPGMFIALTFMWNRVKQDKTKRKSIFIDEGWQLIDGHNEQSARFVERIFKVIRGWGGSAVFATQSIKDLFKAKGNYGTSIIDCSQTKVILGLEETEINKVAETLKLSIAEQDSIRKYNPGDALLCAGPTHVPIHVQASELEHKLITTNRKDLEKMFQEHQNLMP